MCTERLTRGGILLKDISHFFREIHSSRLLCVLHTINPLYRSPFSFNGKRWCRRRYGIQTFVVIHSAYTTPLRGAAHFLTSFGFHPPSPPFSLELREYHDELLLLSLPGCLEGPGRGSGDDRPRAKFFNLCVMRCHKIRYRRMGCQKRLFLFFLSIFHHVLTLL